MVPDVLFHVMVLKMYWIHFIRIGIIYHSAISPTAYCTLGATYFCPFWYGASKLSGSCTVILVTTPKSQFHYEKSKTLETWHDRAGSRICSILNIHKLFHSSQRLLLNEDAAGLLRPLCDKSHRSSIIWLYYVRGRKNILFSQLQSM